jgi:hypothetical protein
MRQVTMVTLLVSILVLIMQCSENEALNSFNGRMEIASAPDTNSYVVPPDTIPNILRTDSIRWVYEFPSGGSSSVSIIISGQCITGQIRLDLGVETYTDSVTRTVPLAQDSIGVFIDTVPIATSPRSGLILTQSSRLFVSSGGQILDTRQMVNPHAVNPDSGWWPPQ